MKIILNLLLVVCMGLQTLAADNQIFKVTATEANQMTEEAEDFIDDLAEGMQDKLADGIYHSLRGESRELQNYRDLIGKSSDLSADITVSNINAGGKLQNVGMRLFKPTENKGCLPLLIYFHGGGWNYGNTETVAPFCTALAKTGNVMVLSIDYPLAPEHRYPEAEMTAREVLDYVFEHAIELGSDKASISVGGDGAGANIAIGTILGWQNNSGKDEKVKSLVLYYPIIKKEMGKAGSWKEYNRGYGLDSRLMESFLEGYGFNPGENTTAESSSDNPDYKNLPPVLIISAERDIVFDDGKEFVENLKKSNGKPLHIIFPGALHGFITDQTQKTAFNKSVEITAEFLSEKQ